MTRSSKSLEILYINGMFFVRVHELARYLRIPNEAMVHVLGTIQQTPMLCLVPPEELAISSSDTLLTPQGILWIAGVYHTPEIFARAITLIEEIVSQATRYMTQYEFLDPENMLSSPLHDSLPRQFGFAPQ